MKQLVPSLTMRRLALVSLLMVVVATPALPSRITFADETAAERAAREIADARDEVAAAAEAYMAATEEIERLSEDEVTLQVEVSALQAEVDALRQQVQQVAINRFTRSSAEGSPILSGFATPVEQMQVSALSEVIWDASDNAFDEFDSMNRDLSRKQTSLQQSKQRSEKRKAEMADLQVKAAAKVDKLKAIEKERLKDEATRKALEAEQARRSAKVTGTAQAAATKVSNGSASSGAGGTIVRNLVVSNGMGGSVYLGDGDSGQGVRFGKGIGYPWAPFGSGGRPTSVGRDYSGASWVCPTGPASVGFGPGFIVPGTPGKQHNGIDIFGQAGTPLVATVDGVAHAVVQEAGGMDVFFYGNNGDFYFYAHLEAWGKMGPVKRGTIIGYMGRTGNAGGNHLHFEYHPGGVGNPQDPYSKLRANC